MNHWAINLNYTLEQEILDPSNKKVKVHVVSTLNGLGFKPNDQCLLMDKVKGTNEADDIQFEFQKLGKVIGVDDPVLKKLTPLEIEKNKIKQALGEAVKPQYVHGIDVEISTVMQQPVLLDNIALSMISVYRYAHPEKHFQQQIRKLPKQDFETIARNLVYVARTAFGKIANALPYENKLDFARLTMDRFKTVDFKGINFIKGLSFLLEYVHDNFIQQGELLIETDNMLREHLASEELDVNQIGLIELDDINEDGEVIEAIPNLVSKQADLFRTLLAVDRKSSFIQDIQQAIKENSEVEARFHQLFSKVSWPIDLKA